jgi:protease II
MNKASDLPPPPTAEQRPHSYEAHGQKIEDPWHWLRDPGYPQVKDEQILDYLRAENAYFEAAMEPHRPLVDQLFEEMKGRIKEDESSVPIRDGDWLYWWAFSPGAQYRSWYRKKFAGGPDEMLFDEPAEAEGKEYFRLGALEVSPDGKLAAVLVDDNGSERFKLRIRDLASGVDTGADAIAKRDAVYLDTGVAGWYAVEVSGVHSQSDFIRLMSYLQTLAVVRKVTALEATPEQLRLQLDLTVGMKGFRGMVATGSTLRPVSDLDSAGGSGGVARFGLQ